MKRRLSKSLASTVITAICLAGTSASYAGAYRDAVLADGPVSYWTFSETDANDVATNIGLLAQSNLGDGTYSIDAMLGAPSLVAGEPDGSFFAAPGSNMVTEGFDKFSDVDGFGGTGFSVEFWTAAEQVSSGYANLVGDGTGGLDFNLMVYSGANGFIRPHMQTLENSYSSIDSTRLPAAGEIVHVVSTWDAETGDFNLYLDGALADTITSGGSLPNPGTPAWFDNPIFVGQDGREASPHAWIDEVAIYNYALSDTRVNLHYLAGQGAPSPLPEPPQPFSDPGNLAGLPDGLVTYIDFDESGAPGNGGILNYAYDRVGDNNGSFQGNATRVPGLIGAGAAAFDNTGGTQVVLGAGVDNSFSVVDGIALEALIQPDWT
ncbi:MAG: LamG domain-containing protein, partial [Planctomycetales bacterium]|nr:LamG domain-containing protein [Planctomycetales bacterium]